MESSKEAFELIKIFDCFVSLLLPLEWRVNVIVSWPQFVMWGFLVASLCVFSCCLHHFQERLMVTWDQMVLDFTWCKMCTRRAWVFVIYKLISLVTKYCKSGLKSHIVILIGEWIDGLLIWTWTIPFHELVFEAISLHGFRIRPILVWALSSCFGWASGCDGVGGVRVS